MDNTNKSVKEEIDEAYNDGKRYMIREITDILFKYSPLNKNNAVALVDEIMDFIGKECNEFY